MAGGTADGAGGARVHADVPGRTDARARVRAVAEVRGPPGTTVKGAGVPRTDRREDFGRRAVSWPAGPA